MPLLYACADFQPISTAPREKITFPFTKKFQVTGVLGIPFSSPMKKTKTLCCGGGEHKTAAKCSALNEAFGRLNNRSEDGV